METIIGIIGAVVVLTAYIGGQLRLLSADSRLYDGLNVFGSGLLIWYAVLIDSVPFIVLNIVWLLFSLKDFVRK